MARKQQHHEEHMNHEAWVIPYADLLTLLLAFFVVMYALSSLNEGKYKIMATSLASAFGGTPTTVTPIQFGQTQVRGSDYDRPSPMQSSSPASPTVSPNIIRAMDRPALAAAMPTVLKAADLVEVESRQKRQLQALSSRIHKALSELVQKKLVRVRYTDTFIEVEIQSDILFASGSATPSGVAVSTTDKIGDILKDEPNAVRVEGYTDNMPIRTSIYPSNWELSSARAASIVHQLAKSGVKPERLAIAGFGEFQPVADNATVEGRNANRRVMLVILVSPHGADTVLDKDRGRTDLVKAREPAAAPRDSSSDVQTTADVSKQGGADGAG